MQYVQLSLRLVLDFRLGRPPGTIRYLSMSYIAAPSPVHHVPSHLLPNWLPSTRTRVLTPTVTEPSINRSPSTKIPTSVVYWMQRDVRTEDNWALLLASHMAHVQGLDFRVVYALPPPFPIHSNDELPPPLIHLPMTERYGSFLLGGLEHAYQELKDLNIPLHVVQANRNHEVGQEVYKLAVDQLNAILIVTDLSPLRQFREWMELQAVPLLKGANVPLWQVDAHNVVPIWATSPKREYAARTIRPRIHKILNDFLKHEFPKLSANRQISYRDMGFPEFRKEQYEHFLQMDRTVPKVDWAQPGTKAGMAQFESFVQKGLKNFDQLRNDPNHKEVSSNLSPWINHGHISFQRITLLMQKLHNKHANATKVYLEEGIIRRELSDNFVFYAPNDYDSLSIASDWAQETLEQHSTDHREYVYTLAQLENGESYEDLWNAAQLQLVREGKMHGFLRMYWAKKILEWTPNPQVALATAQYLNDKYALDGRDPNGFVGVGWSIMGIHDQGWGERPVFGKIRYMNYKGCQRKFKVVDFVARYPGAAENAARAKRMKPLNEFFKPSNSKTKRPDDNPDDKKKEGKKLKR